MHFIVRVLRASLPVARASTGTDDEMCTVRDRLSGIRLKAESGRPTDLTGFEQVGFWVYPLSVPPAVEVRGPAAA